MGRYIDISVPVSSRMTVYPGDDAPQVIWPGWTRAKGDPANVGSYRGGLHHGTHVDAPGTLSTAPSWTKFRCTVGWGRAGWPILPQSPSASTPRRCKMLAFHRAPNGCC